MEDKLFGKDITELYEMNIKELYKIIKENTNYLNNLGFDEVNEIKVTWYHDILILLKNGNLIMNGEIQYQDIINLVFDGNVIYLITKNKTIINLYDKEETFMNNNDYKYKKIIFTPLELVALTYDNVIKLRATIVEGEIDYTKYTNVNDIGYIEENNEIVIIQNNKVLSLLYDKEYTDKDINIVLIGEKHYNNDNLNYYEYKII